MIKVMVVDDSAVVRQVVSECLRPASDLRVIGSAPDPIQARELMNRNWPDVVILDIDMPRMDGITFLKQLMAERPTAVIILSSLTQQGSLKAIEALRAGAVHVLAKSTLGDPQRQLAQDVSNLASLVREAAKARLKPIRAASSPVAPLDRPVLAADVILPPPTANARVAASERIVLIGASTGGTQALEAILTRLTARCPAIAIVQHMPENLTASLARRLDQLCQISVKEAAHGDRLRAGQALISPGGKHLIIKRQGNAYLADVVSGPAVSRHCPSVDVLFRSGARSAGRNATGLLLTGIGDDGAKGLKEMREAGAHTVAQDAASCVVFGMPKEAIRIDAAVEILPLDAMARVIEAQLR
ncbi:protein-glutamate methylesterase/protein-glutamine glutaminase [Chitinilyticum litopenaei]|uniref:protein-glutamate methylesterase/protein-glutamine glutaminase n=1 Tax=Chitinilyticum litopenaei TaxID=1121276 RepID=UPI00041512B4|nr:chemotaxis response regulator protein-glutamate methylesterase [Chitinilyticum litopenaei]